MSRGELIKLICPSVARRSRSSTCRAERLPLLLNFAGRLWLTIQRLLRSATQKAFAPAFTLKAWCYTVFSRWTSVVNCPPPIASRSMARAALWR